MLWAYHTFGSWRPAFIVTGVLGFVWLILFRVMYRRPEDHPRLSAEERALILEGRASATTGTESRLSYRTLLRLPQTWGIIIGKSLTDPVWFFITDWFAIYLVAKGYRLEESLLAFWVPFLAADLGNFAGGGVSSYLIKRGWGVGNARKLVVLVSGLGMTLLIPTVFTTSYVDAGHLLRDLDVRLRGVFDDGAESAGGFVSERIGGLGQRHERHRRRHRHDRRDAADRPGRRSLVVRADPRRRQPDSAGRDRRGARARAQHEGHRARHRQPDLVIGRVDESSDVRAIPHLRWYIAVMLCLASELNYLDRQTLSVLAQTIQRELLISDVEYSYITSSFLISYTIMYAVSGRIIDRIGTRRSFMVFVSAWSVANMLHGLANSARQFAAARFLLGAAEPANFPAGVRAVSEWFPVKERALAIGIFNAGTALGSAVAVPTVSFIALTFGWRSAFVVTGALGFVWVADLGDVLSAACRSSAAERRRTRADSG